MEFLNERRPLVRLFCIVGGMSSIFWVQLFLRMILSFRDLISARNVSY